MRSILKTDEKITSEVKVKEREKEKLGKFKVIDYIIFGSISLIFLLCPLFFTGMVAGGVGFEKMMLLYFLVLIGIVSWVTKGVIEGELKIKRTPLDIPIVAIAIIFTISTFFSISKKEKRRDLWKYYNILMSICSTF